MAEFWPHPFFTFLLILEEKTWLSSESVTMVMHRKIRMKSQKPFHISQEMQ